MKGGKCTWRYLGCVWGKTGTFIKCPSVSPAFTNFALVQLEEQLRIEPSSGNQVLFLFLLWHMNEPWDLSCTEDRLCPLWSFNSRPLTSRRQFWWTSDLRKQPRCLSSGGSVLFDHQGLWFEKKLDFTELSRLTSPDFFQFTIFWVITRNECLKPTYEGRKIKNITNRNHHLPPPGTQPTSVDPPFRHAVKKQITTGDLTFFFFNWPSVRNASASSELNCTKKSCNYCPAIFLWPSVAFLLNFTEIAPL